MAYIIGVLIVIIAVLVIYIVYVQSQIRYMSKLLDKRLKEHTCQPVSLELINPNLNKLAANINKCLKAEEKLRLNVMRSEKDFKEMIANISHDLRTPLTAIKGYQQLMEKGELTEEQRKKLHIANRHAEELGELIEHFFEYSYLVNAPMEFHAERFNLTNLVTECIVASIATLEENNIAVQFEETPQIFICSDKEKVTRIVQNLIRNCIQHSDGNIKVELFEGETEVSISFQNSIKNSVDIDIDRIFDRFYTGDKSRSHSTGLGLSIVKLLSEQMCGRVNAHLDGDMLDIRAALPNLLRE